MYRLDQLNAAFACVAAVASAASAAVGAESRARAGSCNGISLPPVLDGNVQQLGPVAGDQVRLAEVQPDPTKGIPPPAVPQSPLLRSAAVSMQWRRPLALPLKTPHTHTFRRSSYQPHATSDGNAQPRNGPAME